ncbi:hypothetical protein [Sphingobacterium sp. DR205]|uniref:hypothetical protein n=1 Tax=Sphingobacterium sp. DR205 TaxID=2713573 RepID=UPI0013E50794|nr:hypothetical protein [Sphingobacterium sp. DR205]QIH35610.1 hypothetical protein G6053_23255 [Sphingobacterium sp. DR205]
MTKSEVYNILDLLDEIKKIDSLLLLHKNAEDGDFMTSQYEAKKVKLVGELIDALAAPKVQSPQSFSLIQKILDKFYPSVNSRDPEDESLKEIIAAI